MSDQATLLNMTFLFSWIFISSKIKDLLNFTLGFNDSQTLLVLKNKIFKNTGYKGVGTICM